MRIRRERGFTLIELLVVIAVIAILAAIIFPVFAKAQAKAKQTHCLSNIRQLSTATLMFVQDNRGQLMDADTWASDLDEYVGNRKVFTCPLDTNGDGYVSYGLSGLLVGANGAGVKQSNILNPSEVGLYADATSMRFPDAPVLNYGGQSGTDFVKRHSLCISFMDGHAEPLGGRKQFDLNDPDSPVARAFYQAAGFGWVVNPGGGVMRPATAPVSGTFKVGGSTTVKPIWEAAIAGWTAARGANPNALFEGSDYWQTRKDGSTNDVGGASSKKTGIEDTDIIATDAVGIIVSSASKLGLTAMSAAQALPYYTTKPADVNGNAVHVYTRDEHSGTYEFFVKTVLKSANGGTVPTLGAHVIVVSSAQELVSKVSADPYAIGYAGLGEADPTKVTVLDFITAGDAVQQYSRQAVEDGNWGLIRPLYGKRTGSTSAAGDAFMAYVKSADFQQSTLFKSLFFKPMAAEAYPTAF